MALSRCKWRLFALWNPVPNRFIDTPPADRSYPALPTVSQTAVATAPVPPQNLDAEESVLGAMMLSPGAIGAVSEVLDADGSDFYRESHSRIYRAALALYGKGEPVDAITLVDELDERGDLERGRRRRAGSTSSRHSSPRARTRRHYAQIVHESAILRGLIRAGGEIARLGWERPGETATLVDQAEQIVFELGQERADERVQPHRGRS